MPIFSSLRETSKPGDVVAVVVAQVDEEQADPLVTRLGVGLRHQHG